MFGKKVLSRCNLFSAHIVGTSLPGEVLYPYEAIRLQIYLFNMVYTNLCPTLFLPFSVGLHFLLWASSAFFYFSFCVLLFLAVFAGLKAAFRLFLDVFA